MNHLGVAMKNRFLSATLGLLLAGLVFQGCGSGDQGESSPAASEPRVLQVLVTCTNLQGEVVAPTAGQVWLVPASEAKTRLLDFAQILAETPAKLSEELAATQAKLDAVVKAIEVNDQETSALLEEMKVEQDPVRKDALQTRFAKAYGESPKLLASLEPLRKKRDALQTRLLEQSQSDPIEMLFAKPWAQAVPQPLDGAGRVQVSVQDPEAFLAVHARLESGGPVTHLGWMVPVTSGIGQAEFRLDPSSSLR